MLIKLLTIENFRCYTAQSIDFDQLTAILGRNGGGKSTILAALDIFYDIKAPISEEDFFNRETTNPIKIQLTFGDFREGEESHEFSAYISNGLMVVSKVITYNESGSIQKYFASTRQIPQFAELRKITRKTDQVAEFNNLVEQNILPGLARIPMRGADLDAAMTAYETAHPELFVWCDHEEQFFGARNIGGGRLDKYTKFVRIPAIRDVMDDVADKKGSPILQLLDLVVMRRIEAREDVKIFRQEFEERIRQVYSPENLGEIKDLEYEINRTLRTLAPNAELGLRWGDPKIPELSYPAFIPLLAEDGFEGTINRKGHGVQRALIFSLLQTLATLVPANNGGTKPETTQASASSSAESERDKQLSIGSDIILAIDEPELYQHPLRCKHLANVLYRMSENVEDVPRGRNQIIFTTHSPYFANLKHFEKIRIVRKCNEAHIEIPSAKISKYTLSAAAMEMARINGAETEAEIQKYTSNSFYARSCPIMTTLVNEGFFADVVVLVEGLTEAAVLITLANLLRVPWEENEVAVIPVDGKTKLDRAGVVFIGLEIPTYIIFDGDVRKKDRPKEGGREAECNRRLLRLVKASEEDFPENGVFKNYACFQDEFEAYCKETLGEDFYNQLCAELAVDYGYDRPSDVLKNYELACEFIQRIYAQNLHLPLLEQMIYQISNLV